MVKLQNTWIVVQSCGGYKWCKSCNSKHFQNDFNNWTSGNDKIDKFIQVAQLNADIFWKIGIDGFGTIHYARWINGSIDELDIENQQWKKNWEGEVALKKFDNFVNFNDVLNEMDGNTLKYNRFGSIRFYEITQESETHPYDGFKLCRWEYLKINQLDLDFELSKQIGANTNNPEKKNIFGVLPYIAPEVLSGEKEYTKAADDLQCGTIIFLYFLKILLLILNNVQSPSSTQDLYSSLLVNRIWCKVAIPILWELPLCNEYYFMEDKMMRRNALCTRTCISCMDTQARTLLTQNGINLSQAVFDYGKLIINRSTLLDHIQLTEFPNIFSINFLNNDLICSILKLPGALKIILDLQSKRNINESSFKISKSSKIGRFTSLQKLYIKDRNG
ncbi:hypothetical protein Glove_168g18 [Diversispora epigaea]|uniref:Protein kinase domain-containing protein n=1 Tax=Diversispora epigaea TaxID=1348612 RepID=A0A397IYK4_9GLOM|nr:hypothetical protein Glove_168g18 [Diversispora epigaea]